MLYFTDLPIGVNDSGVVAESVTMSHQSPMEQIRGIGYKGRNALGVNGQLRINLDISYYPQLGVEPFYDIVKHYRDSRVPPPLRMKIADISGTFYVESVVYRITNNDIVRANASLVSFEPTERNLDSENPHFSYNDFAYGIYSYATLQDEFRNRLFSFDYNFRANLQPVQKLGSRLANQIICHGGEETFSFVHEWWQHPTHSGVLYDTDCVTSITLAGTGVNNIIIPVESGIIKTLNLDISQQDITRISTVVSRIY